MRENESPLINIPSVREHITKSRTTEDIVSRNILEFKPHSDRLPRITDTEFLSKFNRLKEQGIGYLAQCPCHDDSTPSLSITITSDGTRLLHCFAGC
ncbi:MAG: CHC2 zinc finger domain-containing protein, partial [Acidobacteria bacterium]|nr:CHC2 zinc finger domain-containing protein [Acidobacteriota bacterium]